MWSSFYEESNNVSEAQTSHWGSWTKTHNVDN